MKKPETIADIDRLTDVFRVLGHETRLRLLTLLLEGERSVGEIETITGIGQPGLSQQLAILRKAALVLTRREAKMVFYRVDPAGLADAAGLINRLAGTESGRAGAAPAARKRRPSTGSAAMFAKIL